MNALIFMPIWACIIVIFSKKNKGKILNDQKSDFNIYPLLGSFIIFLPLFSLAAWGTPISDVWAYISIYKHINPDLVSLEEYLSYYNKELGFGFFSYLINWMTHGSVLAFRTIIALIHSIPIILIYRRYSYSYSLSIFLFITSGTNIAWMMNGIRQFMAVTIILSTFTYLIRKKYLYVIIAIAVASLFHKTALIMLPIIFIVHGKAFNKYTMLYIGAIIIASWTFLGNDSLFEEAASIGGYGGSIHYFREMGDDGANILHFVVSLVPVCIAWVKRSEIFAINNPMINICINMSIIAAGLNLIASATSGIMIGRLPIYVSLYTQILLPWLLIRLFKKQNSDLLIILMIFFYLISYPLIALNRY